MVYRLMQRNLAKDLAMVERHIVLSEMHITRQRQRIQNQERNGEVATFSRSLLDNFESCLALHYAHRDSILRELLAWQWK